MVSLLVLRRISDQISYMLRPTGAGLVALLFAACATRPLPGYDWQSPIDLHFEYDSFNNVNLEVICQNRNAENKVTAKDLPLCKSVTLNLGAHGAITPDERARAARDEQLDGEPVTTAAVLRSTPPLMNLTLELTRGPTVTESCGLYAISTILTLGLFPCSSVRTTSSLVRVLDASGVPLETHPLIETDRRIYGSSALLLLINGRGRRERRESDYRLIHFIENRVYTAALRATSHRPGPRAANLVP